MTRVLGVQRFFQMLGQYIWREKIAYTCKLYRVHCGLALTRELGLVNQYLFFISFMLMNEGLLMNIHDSEFFLLALQCQSLLEMQIRLTQSQCN